MKQITLFLAALIFSVSLFAQRGLKEMPDPSIEAQLKAFSLPEGARINLFASEPVVRNPIHMNWDTQGRLWVVGSPLYPHIKPGQEESDQLVVLEDTNGDGVADRHTVFADDLHIPTGVLPGDGGAYVANSNDVLFLKDTTGDGKADHREVVLSGFGTEDTHHIVHTFRWGPEGMMWMNQSVYIHTHLDTPYGIRRLPGGGMWHYRPETRRSEIFCKGLTNPWGHVFDEWGQSFMTDGAGSDGINFVFPRGVFISSPGASRIIRGLNPGQPKLCGLEILSGSHLPEKWRGLLASPDFRGHRIKTFRLSEPQGAAFQSREGEILLSSRHRAFRPVDVKMGPDGAIYVADLYNPIIQHGEVDFRDPRRDHKHGRIWRISFPAQKKSPFIKPAEMSDEELVESLLFSKEAIQRELSTAEVRTRNPERVLNELNKIEHTNHLTQLRKIWVTQAINRFDAELAKNLAINGSEKARAGALRALYYEAGNTSGLFPILEKLVGDSSLQVRLWAVSVLAQIDSPRSVEVALRALDGVNPDIYLDFAVWSICRERKHGWLAKLEQNPQKNPFPTLEQLIFALFSVEQSDHKGRFRHPVYGEITKVRDSTGGGAIGVGLIFESLKKEKFKEAKDREKAIQWIGMVGNSAQLDDLFEFTLSQSDPKTIISCLRALQDAAKMRKQFPLGNKGAVVRLQQNRNEMVSTEAVKLAGLWNVESDRDGFQSVILDPSSKSNRFKLALDGLISMGGRETFEFLQNSIQSDQISTTRKAELIKGQLKIDPATAAKNAVRQLQSAKDGKDRHGLVAAFLSNKFATSELAKALQDITLSQKLALTSLQLAESSPSRPKQLIAAIRKAGDLKPMKTSLSEAEMNSMVERVNAEGDASRGELVYRKDSLQCIACHAIGETGGKIGPNLISIGASAPVDYLIDSLLEPSKKIKEGYHTNLITLKNGDAFAGGIVKETQSELVIRDLVGKHNRISKADISNQTISPVSLMPVGLTSQIREDEFVDLVRFMSELGKEGKFTTTPQRFVRTWEVLPQGSPHPGTLHHYGLAVMTEDSPDYNWKTVYSKVDGSLPVGELNPSIIDRHKGELRVARSFVDVSEAGLHKIRLSGDFTFLRLYLGQEEIPIGKKNGVTEIELPFKSSGRHKVTLIVSGEQKVQGVSLELLSEKLEVSSDQG